jgi:prepilin-type N-terminal cleavage/methylation domain-containing protein
MRGDRGFTLIELLVVIAVIAVLMGILLPSLGMARMHAKRVVSTSNLRQIGLGVELYTEDFRGFFPETSHGLTGTLAIRERSWIFTLKPYVGDVNEIRICPADPRRRDRLEHGTSSYIMNEYIAVDAVDPFGRAQGKSFRNKNRLKRPGDTMTTFVGADDLSPSLTSDHTHSRLWFQFGGGEAWDPIRADIQPDRFRGRRVADNTNGSSLYLYADSRVENLKAQVVKGWSDEGFDFAKPPER